MSQTRRLLLALATVAISLICAHAAGLAQEDMTFKIYCARCHGDAGQGDGADAATLSTRPQNFSDCPAMSKITDDTMFKAIKDGGQAVGLPGDMPAWGSGLSDDEIHGLMKYARHFCQK